MSTQQTIASDDPVKNLKTQEQVSAETPIVDTHAEAAELRASDAKALQAEATVQQVVEAKEVLPHAASHGAEPVTNDAANADADEITETLQPVFSTQLAYRRSTATFPIFHTRFFWMQNEPISSEKLQSLSIKLQKAKMPAEEARELLAHALTSGVGLLFWARSEGADLSGILELAQVSEIQTLDTLMRVTFKYKDEVNYVLDFASRTTFLQFVLGLREKQKAIEEEPPVRSTETFRKMCEALKEGKVFCNPSTETEEQVVSDEEAAAPPATERRSDPKRSSSLLGLLKTKNDAKAEDAKDVISPKKEKRSSFLAFLNKKDNSGPVIQPNTNSGNNASPEAIPGSVVSSQDTADISPAEDERTKDCSPAEEPKAVEKTKQAVIPAKDKVEVFFRNLIKRNEKAEDTPKTEGVALNTTSEALESPSRSPDDIAPALAPDTGAPIDCAAKEPVSPQAAARTTNISPKPYPSGSLARRLTGLFKSKSKKETAEGDPSAGGQSAESVQPTAPTLPEVTQQEALPEGNPTAAELNEAVSAAQPQIGVEPAVVATAIDDVPDNNKPIPIAPSSDLEATGAVTTENVTVKDLPVIAETISGSSKTNETATPVKA